MQLDKVIDRYNLWHHFLLQFRFIVLVCNCHLQHLNFFKEKQLEQRSKTFVKTAKIDFKPRHKSRGKSGTAKIFHIKKTVQEEDKWVRNSFEKKYFTS